MDTQEVDDLTEEGDELSVYRDRAKAILDQIARQTKQALAEHGIDDLTVFFMIQSSGPILIFGTMSDPSENQWEQVSDIVSSVLRQVVGLDGAWSRPVMCASTDDVAGNEHSPVSIPMVASLAGADR